MKAPSQNQFLEVRTHPQENHPKVSIISIASTEDKFAAVLRILEHQTFQNYEFIGEVGNPLPEFWNRAIVRSKDEILVFLNPEARPVNQRWLEELVAAVTDERTIVKGLEVTSSPLDPSSLAGHWKAFKEHPFDEKYLWCEDTDLFSRLKENGYRFIQLDRAPVVHLSKLGSKTYMRRAFRYGLYYAQIRHRYPHSVELMGVAMAMKILIEALLNLLGRMVGSVIFWPERYSRKSPPWF